MKYGLSSCGCALGHPCYWSSGPSEDPDSSEWIRFKIPSPSIIRCFGIAPYRAWWQHRNAPTYAGKQLQLAVLSGNGSSRSVQWTSTVRDVSHTSQMQVFHVDPPVFVSGDWVEFRLFGRQQRQTMDSVVESEFRDSFYTCIQFAGLVT